MFDWKKITLILLDVVAGVYLVLAVTAFNKPDEQANICKDIQINIQKEETEGFLSDTEVMNLLRNSRIAMLNQVMKDINTRQIESVLEQNELIEDAECYKTIKGVLCINIKQRIPVCRVMLSNGEDYYVDTHHEVMPHHQYTCDLLVVTGNVSKQYASKTLAPLVQQIQRDPFWKNQFVQINVNDDRSLEAIPRVGNHVICLGKGTGISKKLERLRKFYAYGLSKTGWNRYSSISVEFDNQIICKRNKRK